MSSSGLGDTDAIPTLIPDDPAPRTTATSSLSAIEITTTTSSLSAFDETTTTTSSLSALDEPTTTTSSLSAFDVPTTAVIVTQPELTSTVPSPTGTRDTASKNKNATPVTVGSAIGALATLFFIGIMISCYRRSMRKRRSHGQSRISTEGSDEGVETVNTATNAIASEVHSVSAAEDRSGNHTRQMEPTNDRQHPYGGNQIPTSRENAPPTSANENATPVASEQRTEKPLPELSEPPQAPSVENFLSSPNRDPAIASASVQEMSLMMQEMDSLRARMAEVVRRQREEAVRNSTLATLAPSDDDDRQTAPPAYSELGDR